MTTTRISPAGISALAALVHELRPDWDRRGIAGAVHAIAERVPAQPLAMAFIRGCTDQTNELPVAITNLENRAWENTWPKCPRHPEERRRRPDGECAGCYVDRREDPDAVAAFDRRPLPEPARELLLRKRSKPEQAAEAPA